MGHSINDNQKSSASNDIKILPQTNSQIVNIPRYTLQATQCRTHTTRQQAVPYRHYIGLCGILALSIGPEGSTESPRVNVSATSAFRRGSMSTAAYVRNVVYLPIRPNEGAREQLLKLPDLLPRLRAVRTTAAARSIALSIVRQPIRSLIAGVQLLDLKLPDILAR